MWGLHWQNDSCDSGHAQRPQTGRECPHHMVYGVVWLNIWNLWNHGCVILFFQGVNCAYFIPSLHLRLKNKLHSNAFTDAMAQRCWENGLECWAGDHGTHSVSTTNHAKTLDFYNLPSMYLGLKPDQDELGLQNTSHRVFGSCWAYRKYGGFPSYKWINMDYNPIH